MPEGTAALLAERGIFVFPEHARARTRLRHLVAYGESRKLRIRRTSSASSFAWNVPAARASSPRTA
jgi:hypothetical protein